MPANTTYVVDTRVLARRQKKTKNTKNGYLCSILKYLYLVNRSQGLEKKKKEHLRIQA